MPVKVPAAACSTARPARHRASEADLIDLARRDQLQRVVMRERERAEQALRQAGAVSIAVWKRSPTRDGLRGGFENDGIARHQRRDDRIHRRQIRIIPGRDSEHDAGRIAPDIALEAVFRGRHDRRQRLFGDADHVAGAFLETAELAAGIFDRPAHLPGQFRRDLGAHRQHGIDRGGAELARVRRPARAPIPLAPCGRRRRRSQCQRPKPPACARLRARRRAKHKQCQPSVPFKSRASIPSR